MNILKFKNLHTFRYRALAFVLSLAVLLSGLVWYGVVQSSQQNADAVYPSRTITYVDTDFYDYYNDTMVDGGGTGSAQGDLKRPFRYFNEAVSQYALNNRWQYPLYLGQFWKDTKGGVETDDMYKENTAREQKSYNYTPKGSGDYGDQGVTLNNFVWAANLAFRSTTNSKDAGYSGQDPTPQFYAATQGLVNGSGKDSKGNLVPTCDGVKLPYFDEDFLTAEYSGKKIAKVYDNKSYPFYATNESVKIGVSYSEDYGAVGSKVMEKFGSGYRFDSNVSGLYFDSSENLIATTNTITDVDGNLGFFPFNESKSDNQSLNYCFGAKYTINFSMSENGTVDGEEWSQEHGTSNDNRAYFTFCGDDDVWVFIDDKLVLDMGGAHKKAEGYIDFANKKSGVLFSANIAEHTGSNSNLRVEDTAIKRSETDLTEIFNSLNLADGKEHKLTMFYMERGMINSNLFVQFNMPTTPHENILTITDKVSVENVNAGLKSQTLAIADSDVARYTISNKGTVAADVDITGLEYPGTDFVRRNNRDFPTQPQSVLLQGINAGPVKEYIYLDLSQFHDWTNASAWFAAAFTNDGISYHWVRCDKLSTYLYRVKIPDTDYRNVIFCRMDGSKSSLDFSSKWNQCPAQDKGFISVNDLVAVKITGYDPTDGGIKTYGRATNTKYNGYPIKEGGVTQEDYKFSGGSISGFTSVANTNYELIDSKAQIKRNTTWGSFSTSSIAHKTSGSGSLNLMYDESAIFTGQFAPSTSSKQSMMRVDQSDTLYKPSVRNDTTVANFDTANGRTLSEYYNIDKPLLVYANDKKSDGSVETDSPVRMSISGGNRDTFEFKNISDTSQKVNIEAIYTRDVKTGSVSITKKLKNEGETSTDVFTMKVEMSSLFGTKDSNLSTVTDYSGIAISGSTLSTNLNKDGTFKMKAEETVKIEGIPVGTVVKIAEEDAGEYFDVAKADIDGNVATGITVDENREVTVTNTRKTGALKLVKKLTASMGAEPLSDDKDRKFTFKVVLTSGDETIDFSKYQLTKGGESLTPDYSTTTTNNDTATFTVEVSANDTEGVTISGIPYGAAYTVTEENIPDYWKEAGAVGDKGILDVAEKNVTITNEEKVGKLTIKKALDYAGAEGEPTDRTTEFKFTLTLTSDEHTSDMSWYDELGQQLKGLNSDWGYSHSDHSVIFTKIITAANGPVEFSGIPYGMKYTVSETDNPGDKWNYTKTVITQDGDSQEFTNNNATDTLDHDQEDVVVTNKVQTTEAYLTIEKYIDELYYGKNDNPHGFVEGSQGITESTDVTNDPFGYLKYTSAEQNFVFKIEASKEGEKTEISYVVLKFGANSKISGPYGPGQGTQHVESSGIFKYKESATVKVQSGWTYKVTELRDENGLAWRYEYSNHGLTAPNGEDATFVAKSSSDEPSCSITINADQSSGIPSVRFFNVRSEKSQKIESDMSSVKNKLTIKQ